MFQRKGKHSQNDIYNIRIHRDTQRETLGKYIKVMVQSWATNKKKNLVALRACNYQSTGLRTTQTTTMTNKQRSTVVVSFFCIYFFFIHIALSHGFFFASPAKFQSANLVASNYYTYNFSYVEKSTHKTIFLLLLLLLSVSCAFSVLLACAFKCKGIVERI